jgi:hypothetical protein
MEDGGSNNKLMVTDKSKPEYKACEFNMEVNSAKAFRGPIISA